MCPIITNKKKTDPTIEYFYKYSISYCVTETGYVNYDKKERLCEQCYASEPLNYKKFFAKGEHYVYIGTRRPRLYCIICNHYSAELRRVTECNLCNDIFSTYLNDLALENRNFYNQADPTILIPLVTVNSNPLFTR